MPPGHLQINIQNWISNLLQTLVFSSISLVQKTWTDTSLTPFFHSASKLGSKSYRICLQNMSRTKTGLTTPRLSKLPSCFTSITGSQTVVSGPLMTPENLLEEVQEIKTTFAVILRYCLPFSLYSYLHQWYKRNQGKNIWLANTDQGTKLYE